MSNTKIIAFYLPQFHPFPENEEWWGKGFTEWTNVGKAKPLFKGHYQPRVPSELGYYDLRLPEVRIDQAKLAKEYGVDGFCYYHYWFGKGKRLMEMPFNEVLKSGCPNFPFMLCWANESWNSKFWNIDGKVDKKLLIEQEYCDENDYIEHFYTLLPAFKDNRYIRIEGKPAFMIYRPKDFKDADKFIEIWNSLAIKNGFNGIYFIGHTENINRDKNEIINKGFDAINPNRIYEASKRSSIATFLTKVKRRILRIPNKVDYKKRIYSFTGEEEKENNVIPTIFPNWDHTPRSGVGGLVYINSTPENFKKHLKYVMSIVDKKPHNKIIFLKSWNEWGEGNYVEPDLKYGRQYLEAIRDCKVFVSNKQINDKTL